MKAYLITYDLRKPGRNYEELFKAIKALGSNNHVLDSVWVVRHAGPADKIRDVLKLHIDANDGLIVVNINKDWATYGVPAEANNWLHSNV